MKFILRFFPVFFKFHLVLVLSLLIVTHSDGTSTPGKYRTLFDYPADALGINDLEGQEDAPIPVTQKSR